MGDIYGVGGVIGAGITAAESDKQARKQRRFIERMRATAYQATMEDMRKAGLNPILAYKTGPTPIGSAAMGHTPDFGQAMASGVTAGTKAAKVGMEKRELATRSAKQKREALLAEFKGRIEADRFNARVAEAQVRFINAQASFTSAKDQMLRTEIPRAEAIKRMDESEAGQFINQSTTAIRRATSAIPIGGRINLHKGTTTIRNPDRYD